MTEKEIRKGIAWGESIGGYQMDKLVRVAKNVLEVLEMGEDDSMTSTYTDRIIINARNGQLREIKAILTRE